MSRFESYRSKFESIRMRRVDGILEMTFHTGEGSLQWSLEPAHREFEQAFLDVSRDRENEVVIMTGTGDAFSGPAVAFGGDPLRRQLTPFAWDDIQTESKALQMNLLNIEVPVISAINGPVTRHPEIPILADIVLAAEDTIIQDSAHFQGGMVPGDGMHVAFQLAMGHNRARYFLITGQALTAQQALDYGLVGEVLPKAAVLDRAWEHARRLLQQPSLVRRYTRALFTQPIKEEMQRQLGFGLALEGLARMRAE